MTSPAPWPRALAEPTSDRHLVHFYRTSAALARTVASWAAGALARGGGAVLIGTPDHVGLVVRELRVMSLNPTALQHAGRLLVVDADLLLSRFMSNGVPDADAFSRLATERVRRVRLACRGEAPEVRAWGEMVSLLAARGNVEAAKRLESLWNRVVDGEGLRLLCSYRRADVEPTAGAMEAVCALHGRRLPDEGEGAAGAS